MRSRDAALRSAFRSLFSGREAGVPARGPCLAVVTGEQGDPRAIVLVDVQAEIFLNEAHTDFMMPLRPSANPMSCSCAARWSLCPQTSSSPWSSARS